MVLEGAPLDATGGLVLLSSVRLPRRGLVVRVVRDGKDR